MHARDHDLKKRGGGGAGKGRAGAYPGLTTLRGATGGGNVIFESTSNVKKKKKAFTRLNFIWMHHSPPVKKKKINTRQASTYPGEARQSSDGEYSDEHVLCE